MGGRIQRKAFFFSQGKTDSYGILIGYYGTKKLEIINNKYDNSERILLVEINIDNNLFVLINIYNANNKPDQLKTLPDLGEILVLKRKNFFSVIST